MTFGHLNATALQRGGRAGAQPCGLALLRRGWQRRIWCCIFGRTLQLGRGSLAWGLGLLALWSLATATCAEELPEYRLKAAFLYNFVLFTEWPAELNNTIVLCIRGRNPFGEEIDALQGKAVGVRSIDVRRKGGSEPLKGCNVVFIPASAIDGLGRLIEELRDSPVLTVADSPGAVRRGVILGMAVSQNKITFEANLQAARTARLGLSSKLLRLAAEVYQ